jgi:hypothetical protein
MRSDEAVITAIQAYYGYKSSAEFYKNLSKEESEGRIFELSTKAYKENAIRKDEMFNYIINKFKKEIESVQEELK